MTTENKNDVYSEHMEELFGELVHDLRGPLQVISNAAYLLEDSESKEMITGSAKRASNMLKDFLEYVKGNSPINPSYTNIEDVLKTALMEVGSHYSGYQQRIVVEEDIQDLGEVYIDQTKMKSVIYNLVKNAVEALDESETEHGKIIIEVAPYEEDFVMKIKDNGPGIPEHVEVFKPLSSSKSRGTGLGLSGSKRSIEAHGGTIDYNTAPDEGTEFIVTLPRIYKESETDQ